MKIVLIALLSVMYLGAGFALADTQKTDPEPLVMTEGSPEVKDAQQQENGSNECWSAKNCTGKILNHKDAHNCKNSDGKSWRNGHTGACTNRL